jgi:ComF family protein
LLFPAACVGCSAEIESPGGASICEECLRLLPLFYGATCERCGAPVPGQRPRKRCHTCGNTKLSFDETIALGQYDGPLREWLLRMKDGRGDTLALAIADLVAQRQAERLAALRPDVVVPVPMHWRRRLMRGTNSPAVMAERLAGHLRLPHANDLLRRTRYTVPQFSLPPSKRPANVRGAFAVRPGYHLHQARVLLVDDILTTGSTCSQAARALKQGGAESVVVVVAARTLRH